MFQLVEDKLHSNFFHRISDTVHINNEDSTTGTISSQPVDPIPKAKKTIDMIITCPELRSSLLRLLNSTIKLIPLRLINILAISGKARTIVLMKNHKRNANNPKYLSANGAIKIRRYMMYDSNFIYETHKTWSSHTSNIPDFGREDKSRSRCWARIVNSEMLQ